MSAPEAVVEVGAEVDAVVVGAGFSGFGMAIRLKQRAPARFLLLALLLQAYAWADVDAGVPVPVVAPAPVGLAAVDDDELLRRELAAVAALGTYRMRFTKNERKPRGMTGVQVMELLVRQSPSFAVVGEVVAGPSLGRRFLYNAALRTDELRVREGGLFGVVGGLWIGVDSSLARTDTNHPITNLGLAPILNNVAKDFARGAALGGHTRVDEGFDADGAWCMRWRAPPGALGLYCTQSFFCVDPRTFLFTRAEISDEKGVFESLRFEIIAQNLRVPDAAFTPEGAGL